MGMKKAGKRKPPHDTTKCPSAQGMNIILDIVQTVLLIALFGMIWRDRREAKK